MAGNHGQGANSIAIGYKAGSSSHPASTITLNATGLPMSGTNQAALYIAPIRNFSTISLLQYNPTTAEIGYSNALNGDITFMSTVTVNSTITTSTLNAITINYNTLTGSTLTVNSTATTSTLNAVNVNYNTLTGSTLTVNSTATASTINAVNVRYSTLTGSTLTSNTAIINTVTVNSTLTISTITAGNIGIGTAVPTSGYALDVNGAIIMGATLVLSTAYPATNGLLRFTSAVGVSAAGTTVGLNYIQSGLAPSNGSAADLVFTNMYNGNEWMRLTAAGRLGIGTASPGYTLHVIGSIYASGDITGLSDKRYKTDVEPIQNALEKVAALKGCSYLRTDYRIGERQIGLIAQDVLHVFPEAVSYDTVNDKYSLNYGCLIAPVIEALKELNEENRVLKEENKRHTADIAELKADIAAIKEHLLL
jgi:hypothetical protein